MFDPLVVTVGEPVVTPEYLAVGTERIITPEPPVAPLFEPAHERDGLITIVQNLLP